jgi:hypothetical protein
MTGTTPDWAMRPIRVEDRGRMKDLLHRKLIKVTWPEIGALKRWAREHHWPAPWFGFKESFVGQMLESDSNFLMGLNNSGIRMLVPKRQFDFGGNQLRDLDELYTARDENGRPSDWKVLVGELRDLRRTIEAGVAVKVDEVQTLHSWSAFYTWADSRFPGLEDGCDSWIGDDES